MFANEAARKRRPARLLGWSRSIAAGTSSGVSMEARGPAAYIAA
jgi:hypothetical protein